MTRASPRRTTGTAPAPRRNARPSRISAAPSIITAMNDPLLFGPHFSGPSWDPWRTILKATTRERMDEAETAFFKSVAGGREPPTDRVRELWAVVGRGGGKDSIASVIGTFTAATFKEQHRLRPGERALVACLACDRKQAKIALNYIRAFFTDVPLLAAMVVRETAEGFELNNRVDIEVGTNSFRAVRGRTLLLAILDEVAFFRDETSAKPDEELYRAIMPAIARLEPHSMLIGISSPYRKAGLLHRKFEKHFGKNDDVLVVQAATRVLNPTFPQSVVDREMADDPAGASAEYGAQFRGDINGWLSLETIQAAVDTGVTVRPPHPVPDYRAFVDPSGGTGKDSFTMAIAHDDMGLAVLDCTIEVRPPFNPMSVIAQIAATLREYRLTEVTGDHYAAGFNTTMFNAAGLTYRNSDRDRSAIYQDCLPLFTSGRVRLLDDARLVTQFVSLERTTTSMGRDKIDHGPGGHDDLANAAAGALVSASVADRRPRIMFG